MSKIRILAACFILAIALPACSRSATLPSTDEGAGTLIPASISEGTLVTPGTAIVPITGGEQASPTLSPLPASPTASPTLPPLAALAQTQTAPFAIEDCSIAPRDYALSPDGAFLAVSCPQGVLRVISPTWTAPLSLNYVDVYGEAHDAPLGLLHPLAWSKDSRYLYFVPAPLTGTTYRLADGAALLRLDVLDNRVSAIVRGADYRQARFAFAISPDGTTLALIDQGVSPLQLILRSIGGAGLEQQVPLNIDSNNRREKYQQAGRILWSADGSRIIVGLSTEGGASPLECEILLVDLAHSSQPVLLEMPAAYFAPLAWLDEDTIVIEDMLTGETRELDVP
jgi:hypothetical protein